MIDARGLTHRYGDRTALDGLDLHVGRGERVALLGPNGAGKTTFMLHLNGLLRPAAGELTVAGHDLQRPSRATLRAVRQRVGLVFQDPDDQLFMPTVAEDVAFGPRNAGIRSTDELVLHALAQVRMEDAADRAAFELSMGEKRRVAIATVLVMAPDVLVLDEPSASLDPRARHDLVGILRRQPPELTMVLATHDLPLAAELTERTVVLDRGRIEADGPTREILADAGLLARHDLMLPAGFDLSSLAP